MLVCLAQLIETPLVTVSCAALKLRRKQSSLMESRVDSHDSWEKNVEVVSKVEAMKGESREKLHQ